MVCVTKTEKVLDFKKAPHKYCELVKVLIFQLYSLKVCLIPFLPFEKIKERKGKFDLVHFFAYIYSHGLIGKMKEKEVVYRDKK